MENVFAAIADPTRRLVLERLREEGALSIKELAAPLDVSRQAVTKHLDVLVRAGLVEVERAGRERRHQLRAQPLESVEAWLEPYARFWDDAFDRLRRHLDEDEAEDKNETKGDDR